MTDVRFIFCVHLHQPVGNFHHVFQRALERCYRPMLEVFAAHPRFRFALHVSGVLLEWFQKHEPEMLIRIRELVDRGQAELLGGGFYEPILAMIPEEDARGQLERMREFLETNFEVRPRGAWLAERVWEPQVPSILAAAGLEYTVVDDAHFLASGVVDEEMDRPFLTEDRGALVKVFPLREALRYAIPFRPPEETVAFLLSRPRGLERPVVVYADDAEKFGIWPGTHKLTYEERWLERFVQTVLAQERRVELATFSEVLDEGPRTPRVYLPTMSYREMNEWAIRYEGRRRVHALVEQMPREARAFVAGAPFRNYRAKYPEANWAYARLWDVSRKVRALSPRHAAARPATDDLYRSQCNCGHWHGVFGGLYLPHLREGVWTHLLRAERQAEPARAWGIEEGDFDLDGAKDFRLYNPEIALWICPRDGGTALEWDLRARDFNLGAFFARRPEVYHDDLARGRPLEEGGQAQTIHEGIRIKESARNVPLRYDPTARTSLRDHAFRPDADVLAVETGTAEIGTFGAHAYAAEAVRGGERVRLALSARASVLGVPVDIRKEISVPSEGAEFQAEVRLTSLGSEVLEFQFGTEFDLAMMDPKWTFRGPDGADIGVLSPAGAMEAGSEIGLVDERRGLEYGWYFSRPAKVYVYPVVTISLSEEGFEGNYQGSVMVPTWPVRLEPGKPWSVVVTFRARESGR